MAAYQAWQLDRFDDEAGLTDLPRHLLLSRLVLYAGETRRKNGDRYKRKSFIGIFRSLQRALSTARICARAAGKQAAAGWVNIFKDDDFKIPLQTAMNNHLET